MSLKRFHDTISILRNKEEKGTIKNLQNVFKTSIYNNVNYKLINVLNNQTIIV